MKKLILTAGILAVAILVNGCGDRAKDTTAQTIAPPQAEGMTEPAVAEPQAAEEVVVEQAPMVIEEAQEVTVETQASGQGAADVVEEVVTEETDEMIEPVQDAAVEVQASEEAAEDVAEVAESAAADAVPAAADDVVVTVNGQTITEGQVSEEVAKRMEGQQKRMPPGMQMPESYSQQIRNRVVDMKVEQVLLDQAMAEKNLSVSDQAVTDEITKIAGQKGQSMEQVEAEIANWGMTMEDLKGQIRSQLQIKALIEAQGTDTTVSEADAQAFYDQNPQYFEQKEQVQASHILIKVEPNATDEQKAEAKKKIDDLLAQVKGGADFAELAKEHSDCPSSSKGGDLGLFGQGQMVPQFEEAAFAMNVGDVSDVVETQFGYHIIKLTDKKEAGKTSFDEAKEQITEFLGQQKQKESWTEYNKTLHDKATIEYSEKEQALRDEMEKAAAAEAASRMMQIQPQTAPAPEQSEE